MAPWCVRPQHERPEVYVDYPFDVPRWGGRDCWRRKQRALRAGLWPAPQGATPTATSAGRTVGRARVPSTWQLIVTIAVVQWLW